MDLYFYVKRANKKIVDSKFRVTLSSPEYDIILLLQAKTRLVFHLLRIDLIYSIIYHGYLYNERKLENVYAKICFTVSLSLFHNITYF